MADKSFQPMGGTETIEPLGAGWERVVRSEQLDDARCFGVIEVTAP